MNIQNIMICSKGGHSGIMSFPEVVKLLMSSGVERYTADLIEKKVTYYGNQDEVYTDEIPLLLPRSASQFDQEAIVTALREIQQNKINYQAFLKQIVMAGCCHYEVYLSGRKVIYFGRNGDNYVEKFPE